MFGNLVYRPVIHLNDIKLFSNEVIKKFMLNLTKIFFPKGGEGWAYPNDNFFRARCTNLDKHKFLPLYKYTFIDSVTGESKTRQIKNVFMLYIGNMYDRQYFPVQLGYKLSDVNIPIINDEMYEQEQALIGYMSEPNIDKLLVGFLKNSMTTSNFADSIRIHFRGLLSQVTEKLGKFYEKNGHINEQLIGPRTIETNVYHAVISNRSDSSINSYIQKISLILIYMDPVNPLISDGKNKLKDDHARNIGAKHGLPEKYIVLPESFHERLMNGRYKNVAILSDEEMYAEMFSQLTTEEAISYRSIITKYIQMMVVVEARNVLNKYFKRIITDAGDNIILPISMGYMLDDIERTKKFKNKAISLSDVDVNSILKKSSLENEDHTPANIVFYTKRFFYLNQLVDYYLIKFILKKESKIKEQFKDVSLEVVSRIDNVYNIDTTIEESVEELPMDSAGEIQITEKPSLWYLYVKDMIESGGRIRTTSRTSRTTPRTSRTTLKNFKNL